MMRLVVRGGKAQMGEASGRARAPAYCLAAVQLASTLAEVPSA